MQAAVRQIRSLPSLNHYHSIKEALGLFGSLCSVISRCDSPASSVSSSSSIEAFHSWERAESKCTPPDKAWHSEEPEEPHDTLNHYSLLLPLYGVVREHSREVQPEMIRCVSSLLLAGQVEEVGRMKGRVREYMTTGVR